MSDIYLSLGTNEGDRKGNIQEALSLLEKAFGSAPKRISSLIETPSWGFSGPDFINCAAVFGWDGDSPVDVLAICKETERVMGRTGGPEWDDEGRRIYHSRIIDIDILFYGSLRMKTPVLTIPHPLITKRDFVIVPLKEIADKEIREAFPDIFEMI